VERATQTWIEHLERNSVRSSSTSSIAETVYIRLSTSRLWFQALPVRSFATRTALVTDKKYSQVSQVSIVYNEFVEGLAVMCVLWCVVVGSGTHVCIQRDFSSADVSGEYLRLIGVATPAGTVVGIEGYEPYMRAHVQELSNCCH
jgi:hypothetical protein